MAKTSKQLVVVVIDRFLLALKQGPASTAKWYSGPCRKFAKQYGMRPCDEITPALVTGWIATNYGERSPSTQHAAARCIVRAFNWAVAERLIAESPLAHYRKPAASRRELCLSGTQYAQCLRACYVSKQVDGIWEQSRSALYDLVRLAWHCGARPQELRSMQCEWVDPSGDKIVFPIEHSKGRRKRRILYLNPTAKRIVQRRLEHYKTGALLRNSCGRRWTKDGLSRVFRRLGSKVGIPGLCCYSLRHAFITRLLERNIDPATVAALAGNSARTIFAHYDHVGDNTERLLALVG